MLETLNDTALSNRVNLIWVPGDSNIDHLHSNINCNDKAYELTKSGALIGSEPVIGYTVLIHET